MSKKYLVQSILGRTTYINLLNKAEIIKKISMRDCSDEEISIYDVYSYGKVIPLKIHGTWHNPKDPLYIKVTDESGKMVFDGLGTDH